MASKAELVSIFFIPPRTALAARLTQRAARSRAPGHRSLAESQASDLRRRCEHVVSCLPDAAVNRICDGKVPGSHVHYAEDERRDRAVDSLAVSGGAAGESLTGHLTVLAALVDFAAAGGFKRRGGSDIFASGSIPPPLLGEFLAWERARGFVCGAVGAAPSALVSLRFLADHMGLPAPDLSSDVVTAHAKDSLDVGEVRPDSAASHCVPLRLVMGREAFAGDFVSSPRPAKAAGFHEPAWAWACSRIIAFKFGLRGKELRSARLVECPDSRIIRVSFHPKGDPKKPRIDAYRWACGVLGAFLWWPAYKALFISSETLLPKFQGGHLLLAESWARDQDGHFLICPNAQVSKAAMAVATMPDYGLPEDVAKELKIEQHSDHGSANAVQRSFGAELGFNVIADGLIAGHWMGSTPPSGADGADGARGGGRPSAAAARQQHMAAREAAMPARYADAEQRRDEGTSFDWRVLGLAHAAVIDLQLDWTTLDPRSGWSTVRTHAVEQAARGGSAANLGVPPFWVEMGPAGTPCDWALVPGPSRGAAGVGL